MRFYDEKNYSQVLGAFLEYFTGKKKKDLKMTVELARLLADSILSDTVIPIIINYFF